jgi:hypothetical protein
MTDEEKQRVYDAGADISGSTGVYRHQFRAPKR